MSREPIHLVTIFFYTGVLSAGLHFIAVAAAITMRNYGVYQEINRQAGNVRNGKSGTIVVDNRKSALNGTYFHAFSPAYTMDAENTIRSIRCRRLDSAPDKIDCFVLYESLPILQPVPLSRNLLCSPKKALDKSGLFGI